MTAPGRYCDGASGPARWYGPDPALGFAPSPPCGLGHPVTIRCAKNDRVSLRLTLLSVFKGLGLRPRALHEK